jgi:PAS domain S-box-containing protein/putative nucleotidyltransferase with HDIG domain
MHQSATGNSSSAAMSAEQVRNVLSVLDALNCGAGLLDRSGVMFHANPRLCQMMGRNIDQIAGKNIREFYQGAQELGVIDEELARADEPRDIEFVVPRPDGSRVPVVTSSRPLPPPLNDLHVVTIIDIARRKNAENDLRELVRSLSLVGDNAMENAIEFKEISETLERKVQQRTQDLQDANLDAIYMLAIASEAKDADTGRHVRRIQRYAEALAKTVGLSENEAYAVGYSAILHDVGKIHVPDEILKKPGPLDDDQQFVMRQHTLFGERILSKRPFFDRARRIARSHHENWDGSGYPDSLGGNQIPIEARIVRVVDVYDALTTARVYKPMWTVEQAIDFIRKSEGTLFEKEFARAFCAMVEAGEVAKLTRPLDVPIDL